MSTTESNGQSEYTDEDLIEALQEAAHGDIGPTKSEFSDFHDGHPSGTTVQDRFDGWITAVREAGLIPKYNPNREEMLKQLRAVSDDRVALKAQDFDRHSHTVSLSTIYKEFGTYTDFAEEAGLNVQHPIGSHKDVTKEEIKRDLNQLSENGTAPTAKTVDNHPDTVSVAQISAKFDSYNAAVEAAGLETRRTTGVTEDEVINDLQMLSEDGKAPTAEQFNQHPETPSVGVVIYRFGTWDEAVEAAGLEKNLRGSKNPSKEEIKAHLQRIGGVGEPPKQVDVTNDDHAPSVTTIKTKFNGWGNALEAAGFEPPQITNNRISEVEIVDHLRRIGDGDTIPTQQDVIDDAEAPHVNTIKSRIGWEEALDRAGYTDHDGQFSDGELIYHLQRVADGDTAPTQAKFNADPDAPHASTVKRRLGWDVAVERAGLRS